MHDNAGIRKNLAHLLSLKSKSLCLRHLLAVRPSRISLEFATTEFLRHPFSLWGIMLYTYHCGIFDSMFGLRVLAKQNPLIVSIAIVTKSLL